MDGYTDEEATLLAEFGTSIVGWGESDVLPSRPVWEGNLPQSTKIQKQKSTSQNREGENDGDAVFLTGTSLEHHEEDAYEEPGHRTDDIVPPSMWDLTDIDTKMYQLRMTTTAKTTSHDDDELDTMISGYLREADDELARNTKVTTEERNAIFAQAQRLYLGVDEADVNHKKSEVEGDDDPFDDDPLTQEEKDLIEASAVQRITDHAVDPNTTLECDEENRELNTLHDRQQRAQDVYVNMVRKVAGETVDVSGELQRLDTTSNPTRPLHQAGASRAAWVTSLRPPQVNSFVDPELLACEARIEEELPPTATYSPPQIIDTPLNESRTYNSQSITTTTATITKRQTNGSRVTVATADKFFPSSDSSIVAQPSVLPSVEVPGHTTAIHSLTNTVEARRRKLQQRADWLSMQEVMEGVKMRQEDEKVIKAQRQYQAQLLIAKREQDAFFPFEGKERQEIAASEVLAFADIRERERRQKGVLEQFLRHKAMQHQAAKISDVVSSEGQIRANYVDMEIGEWQEVQGKFDSHHKDITTRDAARAAMLESALSGEDRMQLYEDEDDDRRHLFAKLCRGESEATLRLAERQAEEKQRALREEQEGRVQRVRGHIDAANVPSLCDRLQQIDGPAIEQDTFTKCSKMLQALKGRTTGSTHQRPTSAPPTPRTTSPPPHPQHTSSNPFDAAALLRLYPFGSTPSNDPSTQTLPPTALAAVTAFRSINGALEDFTGIDFDSLQRCSVGVSVGAMANNTTLDRRSSFSKLRGMTDANRQLPVAPLVEELNLGNNTFSQDSLSSSVDLARLLSVFPALQHVLLSGSGICGVGGDVVTDITPPPPSKLTRLDVSNNLIEHLPEHMPQMCPLLMQLTAFANSKMTESSPSSSTWLHLAVVELSRTNTTDVSWMVPSGACLSSVDVTRTPLSDISPLLTNPVPFIQSIYASHCQLSSMPSSTVHPTTGLFLRHLFIGGNASLTHLGFAGQFPFLSVLKAESCQLQSIEGIKGCPLLETLDVSFNDLDTLNSLLPLGMCPSLKVLNINENPISKGSNPTVQCTITNAGTTTTATLQIKKFVLGMCQKSIEEYGNDLVDTVSKKSASEWWNSISSSSPLNNSDGTSSAPYDPLCPSINALKGSLETSQVELEGRIPTPWVRLLGQLNKEWTAVSLVLTRRYQRAVAAENGLQKRLRVKSSSTAVPFSSSQPAPSKTSRLSRLTVGLYRDSNTAWVEMIWGRIALLSKHLTLMCAASRSPKVLEDLLAMGLAAAGGGSDDVSIDNLLAGMGCGRSPWDNLPLAITARGIVRQFLLGQVLIRRAKRELAHLKATSTMYGDAATKISSTWRGHRVRRRLAAVRDDDDDDDAMYQKVAWSEPDGQGSVGVAGLMRTALTNHGTAQVFNQPIEMVAPPPSHHRVGSAPGMLQGNASHPLPHPSHILGAHTTTRLGGGGGAGFVSGVRGAVGGTTTLLDGGAERPSSVPTPPPPRDEWTSAMQAHLQNKQSKINKQQAANLRKEYLVDPLKAKQASTRK